MDEDLLLLKTGPQPSNSMSVHNNFSNFDSTSNSQGTAQEDGVMGANYDGGFNGDNSSENKSDNYESAELGQNDSLSNSTIFPISNNTLHLQNSASSVGAHKFR